MARTRPTRTPWKRIPIGSRPCGTWRSCWNTPGASEEAERYYRQILEKAPREEEARFRLGFLRLQRQDFRGAAEAFEGCLKYRPAWPEAHANLALSYSGMGEREHAERLYEKMLEPIRSRWKRCAVWPPWRFRHPTSIPPWSFTCG
jgi:tetratricopeptide (TPR) repeat protein